MARNEGLRREELEVYHHLKTARACMDRRANLVAWSEIDAAITKLEALGIGLDEPPEPIEPPEYAKPAHPLKA
jgi:hypothetical protein